MSQPSRPTALCVESQTRLQPIVDLVLKRVGFGETRFANNLESAREQLNLQYFDMVAIDVHVAHGNRQALRDFLQTDFAAVRPLTILMVTSLSAELSQFASELQVDCVIRKPFTPVQFATALKQNAKAHLIEKAIQHPSSEIALIGDDTFIDKNVVYL